MRFFIALILIIKNHHQHKGSPVPRNGLGNVLIVDFFLFITELRAQYIKDFINYYKISEKPLIKRVQI